MSIVKAVTFDKWAGNNRKLIEDRKLDSNGITIPFFLNVPVA